MKKIQKPKPPTGFQRLLWRLPITLFRAHLGFLVTKRIMLLTHTGRASGRPRQAALEVVEHGDDGSIVAASGFGRAADWYKNVRKTPRGHHPGRRPRSSRAGRRAVHRRRR